MESAAVFGLGCCIVIYWAAPKLGESLDRIPERSKWILAGALLALFGIDVLRAWAAPNIGVGVAQAVPAAVSLPRG